MVTFPCHLYTEGMYRLSAFQALRSPKELRQKLRLQTCLLTFVSRTEMSISGSHIFRQRLLCCSIVLSLPMLRHSCHYNQPSPAHPCLDVHIGINIPTMKKSLVLALAEQKQALRRFR